MRDMGDFEEVWPGYARSDLILFKTSFYLFIFLYW